ncbi:MAG: GGDEF domain-containing protein, partial [Candidatus Izimaplasma sp.]|nr:GGDEF domain-containing protein [Candidatus Izimaplasma bacterium]
TQAIYDLAIQSGNIGIYYYNFQKYSEDRFHANDIYANMFGLEPDDNGLYLTKDFVKAVLEIEDEITDENQTLEILHELFSGSIKGTTDDVLKIKHLKTGEIKYLLSSAKVEARYSNGKPKVFGGVVIDITERIKREKTERQKSLYDPLTSIGNNRKLLNDLETANDGVGIFFDLDNFKKINDTHGHLVGDEMIKLYSEILSSTDSDIDVYRLYGDEFFVFAEGKDESWAKSYIAKITDISKKKSKNLNYDFVLSGSSGMESFSKGDDINDFIKECDYEMYREKIKKHDKQKR